MNKRVVFIAGPTASGKSAAAIAVASRLGGDPGVVIINADSMQVYRDLEIISARPGQADEALVPHRLYGVLDGAMRCSVGRWREMALAEIKNAFEAGLLPLVVGGTGLYFKSLIEGLAPVPDVPSDVMAAVTERFDDLGEVRFRLELAADDPAAEARIGDGDRQRLLRAAGVFEASGQSLSDWQSLEDDHGALKYPLAKLLIIPDRDVLYARCEGRFQSMIDDGALAEVLALTERGLDSTLPVMKAVGVPELVAHLAGQCNLETAVSDAQQATRRYVKHQLTWARHQMADWQIITEQDSERLSDEIFSFIHQLLLTPSG